MHIDLTKPTPGVQPRDTYVTFVLDETQSMQSIATATVNGFNEYLETLKRDPERGEVQFSLVKFNSWKGAEKVYVGFPVRDIPPMTMGSYQPNGMTPLVDAVYEAILATERAVAGRNVNVLVVVQTDGQENFSRQHSTETLRSLLRMKQSMGWVFVFLGAGIDAFATAGQYGFSQDFTASYDRARSGVLFGAMATKTAVFRATGNAGSMSFNAADRKDLGGVNADPDAS